MARLLADQDFRGPIIRELQSAGHDVLTPHLLGWTHIRVPDPAVLARAIAESRILLTHNSWHFKPLHRMNNLHSGIILVSQHPDWRNVAQNLKAVLDTLPTFESRLILVDRIGFRAG